MSKTPLAGVVLGLLVFAGGAPSAMGAAGAGAHPSTDVETTQVGSFKDAVAGSAGERPAMNFTEAGSKSADLPLDAVAGQATAPLPLSQLAGGANASPRRGPFDPWDLINQIRYGGLPEWASWCLMLVGFGMIGGALRGFMVANRRLAGLQAEVLEDAPDSQKAEGSE